MSGTEFDSTNAQVGVIMGSRNDWETMKHAADILDSLEIMKIVLYKYISVKIRK